MSLPAPELVVDQANEQGKIISSQMLIAWMESGVSVSSDECYPPL
jgi:hypothetical protein